MRMHECGRVTANPSQFDDALKGEWCEAQEHFRHLLGRGSRVRAPIVTINTIMAAYMKQGMFDQVSYSCTPHHQLCTHAHQTCVPDQSPVCLVRRSNHAWHAYIFHASSCLYRQQTCGAEFKPCCPI